jgi:hypothetical protein
MLYQKKNIAENPHIDVGTPAPLPPCLRGSLTDELLADLSWFPDTALAEAENLVGMGFFPYAPPSPPPPPQTLEKIDFLRLFTSEELANILAAAETNPLVAVYQYKLANSTVVSLSDPDVVNGLPLMELAGLLAPGRAVQILAGEPPL